MDGPHPYAIEGKFWIIEEFGATPAFRPGVHLGARPLAFEDPSAGKTNWAAAVRIPINLPSWDHVVQIWKLSRKQGFKGWERRKQITQMRINSP